MANLTNAAKLIEEMEKKVDSSSLASVATSWSYTDLSNQPTIPTVNDSTITVQKNGADVDSFTTNAAAWKTINIQLTKADVWLWNVDNTSDANKPISNATQTALNAKADVNSVYTKAEVDSAISSAVSSVYKYKGSVANYASLPSTWLTAWDVYNVADSWMNYAWTGSAWDALGSSVDLSNYFNKTTDTTDNITQGNNKFVSTTEKSTWNWKQDALTTAQLNAANSWITSTKVSTYDWYATTIANKANTSDVLTKTNTTAFTPTGDYQPATKKYVDDNAGNVIAMTQAEYEALPEATKNDGKLRIITDAPEIEIKAWVTSVNGQTGDVTIQAGGTVYCTFAEYDALPSTKLTDWVNYIITDFTKL